MKKELKDLDFAELVDEATREIHSGLLEGGGKEMRNRVWLYLNTAINWSKEK